MKRLHLLLACVAAFSLAVAAAWAAEETSWGDVKSGMDPQPAAKVARYAVSAHFYNPDESQRTADDINKGEMYVMKHVGLPWLVEGDLVGSGGIRDGHWLGNAIKDPVWWPGPENFVMYFQGKLDLGEPGVKDTPLDGLEGAFEGRCSGGFMYGPYYYETMRGVLHGSGELEGLRLDFVYTNYQSVTFVDFENELVGEIVVTPSFRFPSVSP